MKRIARPLPILVLLISLVSMPAECIGGAGVSYIDIKMIQASEILYKIKMGQPVNYQYVTIKGDLDLNKLDLPIKSGMNSSYSQGVMVVSSPITIEYSQIEGNLSVSGALFENLVDFKSTTFKGDANFFSSIFNETITFSGSAFNGDAFFRGTKFNRSADFSYSEFTNYAAFGHSIFSALADFGGAKFDAGARFAGSIFNGTANFGPTAIFPKTILSGGAGMEEFFEEVFDIGSVDDSFNRNTFSGNATFEEVKFNETAYFTGRQFIKTANFRGAEFKKGADFNKSAFKETNDFRGSIFLGFLNLTGATFDRLDIYWPQSTRLICDDGITYLALIKNFRDLERFEVADEIYYEYRAWKQDHRPWSDWYKYFDMFALCSCGYGVRIDYTIRLAAIILIFFGLIYFWISKSKNLNNENNFEKLSQSLWLSLVILLSAPKELYPLGDDTYNIYIKNIKYWPIIERLAGWGLLLLFINTLSRVMIRY